MCALYSGPAERDRLLFPFLREGIREGDKCLCLIDDAEVASSVRDGVDGQRGADQPGRSEQLDVDRTSDAYLESGRFSVEQMRSFLSGRMILAAESDFPMLRAAGEMSWVLPQPGGADDFFVYESAVSQIVEDMPAVFMCMYDLQRFGVPMLVDILRTHPKVLLGPDRARQPSLPDLKWRIPRSTAPRRPDTHWPRFRRGGPLQQPIRGDHSQMLSSELLSWWPAG